MVIHAVEGGALDRVRFVFIVDDDGFIAAVARALASDGFDVVFARDWVEGRLSIGTGAIGVAVAVESVATPSHAAELRALKTDRPDLVTVLLNMSGSGRSDGAHLVASRHAGLSELIGVFHDAESVRTLTAKRA